MEGLTPPELEEWTFGEVLLLVRCRRKARRLRQQERSVIAWQQALLTARALSGGTPEPVYELFPFWEEEEKAALRLESCRALMERLAGRGGVSDG